jgi:hypothetical protein
MLVSQKLALAAHLHVLLRRKTGRVTDTEWMAGNLEYAKEIIRFARAKAEEDGHPELAEWAGKFERAVLEQAPPPRVPLAQAAAQLLRERSHANGAVEGGLPGGDAASTFGDTGFADSVLEPGRAPRQRDPPAPRYVGGIR